MSVVTQRIKVLLLSMPCCPTCSFVNSERPLIRCLFDLLGFESRVVFSSIRRPLLPVFGSTSRKELYLPKLTTSMGCYFWQLSTNLFLEVLLRLRLRLSSARLSLKSPTDFCFTSIFALRGTFPDTLFSSFCILTGVIGGIPPTLVVFPHELSRLRELF